MLSTPAKITNPNALSDAGGGRGVTVFLTGHPGSRKSTWAAGWPAPVFLTLANEGGDDSLITYPTLAQWLMQNSKWQEQGHPFSGMPPVANVSRPPNFEIKSYSELDKYVDQICQNHKAWGIRTVVVDGLNYLVDQWIEDTIRLRETQGGAKGEAWAKQVRTKGGEVMGPQEWGMLNLFLNGVRVRLGALGLNVIWTCHQLDHYKSSPTNIMERTLEFSEPMLSGRNRITLPGSCKMIIQADLEMVPSLDPKKMGSYEPKITYRTAPTRTMKMIRHKYGFAFPQGHLVDPEFGPNMPTFRAVWAELHPFINIG
jgi:hypothetical protein